MQSRSSVAMMLGMARWFLQLHLSAPVFCWAKPIWGAWIAYRVWPITLGLKKAPNLS